MVKKVQGYMCETCGYGSFDEAEIAEHEKKPTQKIVKSLDGLVIRIGEEKNFTVFRRIPEVEHFSHDALYTSEKYDLRLRTIEKPFDEFERSLGSDSRKGKTAQLVMMALYLCHSENTYRNYHILSEEEFIDITERLRKKYPELYQGKGFRRDLIESDKWK